MSKLPTINLNKGRHQTSFFETFVTWSLTIGRIIVITTEAVALAAFLYRFKLDQQLVDLHDNIKLEQVEVAQLKKGEDNFRNIQDRLEVSRTLSLKSFSQSDLYHNLMGLIPTDITVQSVAFTPDAFHLDASSSSIDSLSSFIEILKGDKKIKALSLDRLENKASKGIVAFTITATLGNGSAKPK